MHRYKVLDADPTVPFHMLSSPRLGASSNDSDDDDL